MRKFIILFTIILSTVFNGWSQQSRVKLAKDLTKAPIVEKNFIPHVLNDNISKQSFIKEELGHLSRNYDTNTNNQRGGSCILFAGGPYADLRFPPCQATCGTPNEAGYQVWENEAYLITCSAGSQYTFEFCNGYSAATWPAVITVGVYNGFGGVIPGSEIASANGCTITFTTEFDRNYVVVVSGETTCGGDYNTTNNGFVTIDCGPDGASCSVCIAGTLVNSGTVNVCSGSSIIVGTNGDQVIPQGGGYGWNFTPGVDGTGGPFGGASFSFGGANPVGNDWGNDLNGSLGTSILEGTWIINGFSYSNGNDIPGSVCESTPINLIVSFLDSLALPCLASCEPDSLKFLRISNLSARLSWRGDAESYDLELVNTTIGEMPTGIPTVIDASNPHTFTGLDIDNNEYQAWIRANCFDRDLVLSGIIDATLPGGLPKAIELYALNDIDDLSHFGIGVANDGGGSDGVEFVLSGSASAGEYIYISSQYDAFVSWFEFEPDFVTNVIDVDGNDAVELFEDGVVLDVFGEINIDGVGEAWEYTNGWAYRFSGTGPDGNTFVLPHWFFSGPGAILDGDLTNVTCNAPFPFGMFTGGYAPSDNGWEGPVLIGGLGDGEGPGGFSCFYSADIICGFDEDINGNLANDDDAPSGCSTSGAGLWYKFVGDNQNWEITATPQSSDIEIQIYSGSCSSLTCIANVNNSLLAESILLPTISDIKYYMYVGGVDETATSIGEFNLNVRCTPINDICESAIAIRIGVGDNCENSAGFVSATTVNATESVTPTCDASTNFDIWYKFTASSETISFTSITGGPGLEILDGTCDGLGNSLGCLANESGIIGGLTIGNDYYALVWTNSEESSVEFCITTVPVAPNDECDGAISVNCTTDLDVEGEIATSNGAPNGCSTSGAGLWYTFNGDNQIWEIVATPETANIEIQVYSGSCDNLLCVAEVNNSALEETLTLTTVSGTSYYMYIGGFDESVESIDAFNLSISCAPQPPGNDLCGDVETLNCGDVAISGSTLGATADDVPTGGCSTLSEGVWYVFEGTADEVTIDVNPIGWNPELDLSSGSCGTLTPILCINSGGNSATESVTFLSEIGTDYYLYVSDFAATIGGLNAGNFTIDVTCVPPICEEPTNLVAENITNSTAVLSWTSGDDESSWDLEIVNISNGESFTGSPTVSGITDTFYLATGLDSESEYEFYVLANCQIDESDWAGPMDFETMVNPPSNDNCFNATQVTCNAPALLGQSTVGAVIESNPVGCSSNYGVWYFFIGNGEIITVISANPSFNHELDVFSSDGECGGNFSVIVCRDASLGTESTTFNSIIGTQYYIYVAHANPTSTITGTFDLEVTCSPPPVCEAPTNLIVSNITSTSALLNWTPGDSETLWNLEIVDLTNDGSFLGIPTVSGLTNNFYLATGLNSGNEYEFYVSANCGFANSDWVGPEDFETLLPAPINDSCGGAIEISCDDIIEGSTASATADGSISNCGTTLSNSPGIWYSFAGNGEQVTFSLCGSSFDSKIGVFSGSCNSLVCEIGEDDDCGTNPEVTLTAEIGTDYYIYVTGYSGASGDFILTVSCEIPTPINNVCAGVIAVVCNDVVFGSTAGATADASLDNCGTSVTSAPGVWYSFVGTGDDVTFSLCNAATDYDSKLAVFTGACAGLICVDANDDECGTASEVEISSEIGEDYFIYVSGFSANTGNFGLSVSCVEPSCDTSEITLNSIINVVCGNDGAIDVTVSGGSGSYDFLWSNGETTEDVSGLSVGDYTLEVTDSDDGCPSTATFSVGGNDALEEIESAIVVGLPCDGSPGTASIDITMGGGTPPYQFTWNNGATTEDLVGLVDGTYILTVTDANNCVYISQSFVINPAGTSSIFEVVPAVVTDLDCFGNMTGAIDITISGGIEPYTYRWGNDLHTEDIENLPPGEYIFFVVDATGCEYISDPILIGSPDPMDEAIDAIVEDASCNDESNGSIDITIFGGNEPYSYLWTNGSTEEDPNDFAAGTHQVIVTDANGCTFLSENVVINEPSSVALINTEIISAECNGDESGAININVVGGTPGYSFVWSNTTFEEDLYDAMAGDYSVTVTDSKGCSVQSQTFTINEPTAITTTAITVVNADCIGAASGSIDIFVIGGVAPYTYNWSNGATTQDISGLIAGEYTGVVTDASGCVYKLPFIIVDEPAAINIPTALIVDADCNGASTGSIDITVIGGTSPYTFEWNNGATSQDLSNTIAGIYSCEITDINGCVFNSATYAINQPDAIAITSEVITNLLCNGDSDGAIDIEVSGGTGAYTYLWDNGEITQDIGNLIGGEHFVTITDSDGCIFIETINVEEPEALLEAMTPVVTSISCFGEPDGAIDISIQGGTMPYIFEWNIGASTEDLIELGADDYSYIVTDTNGCVFDPQTILTIVEPAVLSETAVVTDAFCLGGEEGSIDLTVIGGTEPYTFNWSNGDNSEDLVGVTAGDYSVEITDANDCILNSETYTVSEPTSELTATVEITEEVVNGVIIGTATVTASGGDGSYTFIWTNGFGTGVTIDNLQEGIYCVDVTDANGCEITVCGVVGTPISVTDLLEISEFSLYPNPTSSFALLDVSFTKAFDIEIAIVDVLGRVYESIHFSKTKEVNNVFDMNPYAAGTYFFRITTEKQVITKALVVH